MRLTFDHPESISNGNVDELQITFFNSEAYLEPSSDSKATIPEGYQISVMLPSQTP